jgi:hypothetical protein
MAHYDSQQAEVFAFASIKVAIRNKAADAIKEFFARDPLKAALNQSGSDYDFTFDENNDKTKMFVATQFPDEERQFPCVIVGRANINTMEADLGQNLGPRTAYADQYEPIKGGLVQGTLGITAAATTENHRSLLFDILTIALSDRLKLRPLFAQRGINLLSPFVTDTGEGMQILTNMRKVFTASLQINVQGMWQTLRVPPPLPIIEDVVKEMLPIDRHLTGDIFG